MERDLNDSQKQQLNILKVDVESLKDHQKSLATKVDHTSL